MSKKMFKNVEKNSGLFLLFKIFYVNFQNFSLILLIFSLLFWPTIVGHRVTQVYYRQMQVEIIHD